MEKADGILSKQSIAFSRSDGGPRLPVEGTCMPNHRIIHTILTIGIAASWQAASRDVRACERCVVYLNSPACQDCVPAILPDDARTIDVQLAWTLEQNRPCVCRAVANLTLDLLASRPSISGQEYFGVLQRTACGQRIAAGLGPIAAGRNFHPYLSKDQVVLLKSAVAISSMDPDLAAGRRVIAKAAYLAGEIISANPFQRSGSQKPGRHSLFRTIARRPH